MGWKVEKRFTRNLYYIALLNLPKHRCVESAQSSLLEKFAKSTFDR